MYNEEHKSRFLRVYTRSEATAHVATNIFNRFEPCEAERNADLCTMSADVLQPIVDEIVGLRTKSKWMGLSILKEYARWCIDTRYPGACDGMFHVDVTGIGKIRQQMVSGPAHLQSYLDTVYDKESELTIDNIYRCSHWLSYGGASEDTIPNVRISDVDFETMSVRCGERLVPIYREGLEAFRNCAKLSSFRYKHPNYRDVIIRDRLPGDELLRGIKSKAGVIDMRAVISKRAARAAREGRSNQRLSYNRVSLSGLFYRTLERERMGVPVDFSDATEMFIEDSGIQYKNDMKTVRYRITRDFEIDYQRWKLAFNV